MSMNEMIDYASGPISENITRGSIQDVEDLLSTFPQVEIPVVHRYSGGIYAREIIIPKGIMLTGRIYKDDHFDVMVYGDVTVTTDEGRKRLTGFNISIGNRGKKRAGYTHEETKWITFCSSKKMDDDNYLDHLTVGSFDELLEGDDKTSYLKVLSDFGVSEDIARSQSEDESDQIKVSDSYKVKVSSSEIEGQGLFSTDFFLAGDVIMPARIGDKRTEAGRYTNHSASPNAEMVIDGDNINLVAIKDIEQEEITTDYAHSLSLQIERVK